MTGNHRNRGAFLALAVAVSLAIGSTAVGQRPSGSSPRPSLGPQKAVRGGTPVAPSAANTVVRLASSAQEKSPRRVHLAVDGNLPGRVVRAEALVKKSLAGEAKVTLASNKAGKPMTPGKNVPVRAKIWFFQNGQVVNEVKSDPSGRFQVVGLTPGKYSVVAMGEGAAGAVSVELLPYQPDLAKESTVLTIALGEPPTEENAEETRQEEFVEYGFPSGGGAVGGAGGGGGAMLGLVGLAGLGGLGGLGGGGGGGPPASPVVP